MAVSVGGVGGETGGGGGGGRGGLMLQSRTGSRWKRPPESQNRKRKPDFIFPCLLISLSLSLCRLAGTDCKNRQLPKILILV